MKNLKMGFFAVLSTAIMFSFIACDLLSGLGDAKTDKRLEVEFSATGTENDSSRTVKMTAPAKYDDYEVYIIYTTDESDPEITFDSKAYKKALEEDEGEPDIYEYVDYGTAILYQGPVTFTSSVNIKANAFYVKKENVYKGASISEFELKVKTAASTVEDTGTVNGTFNFKLASSGNTPVTHYYDTSATNVFKFGEYEHCYYQIQFTIKSKGSGKWYLYVRQLGNASPIKNSNGDTNFVALGTYTGNCFDDYSKIDGVVAGTIDLTCTVGDKSYGGPVTISKDSTTSGFEMKVNGVYGSSISVGNEK